MNNPSTPSARKNRLREVRELNLQLRHVFTKKLPNPDLRMRGNVWLSVNGPEGICDVIQELLSYLKA